MSLDNFQDVADRLYGLKVPFVFSVDVNGSAYGWSSRGMTEADFNTLIEVLITMKQEKFGG